MQDRRQYRAARRYAQVRLEQNCPTDRIREELIDQGLDEETAAKVVVESCRKIAKANSEMGTGKALFGAFVCLLGVAGTAVTMSAAKDGEPFTVYYGMIIVGAMFFVRSVGIGD